MVKKRKPFLIVLCVLLAAALVLGGVMLAVRRKNKAAEPTTNGTEEAAIKQTSEETTEETLRAETATNEAKEETTVRSSDGDEKGIESLSLFDLQDKLDSAIEKKKLNDIERGYLELILKDLYENYDSWRRVGVGFPSKEEFICRNLIEPLNDCRLHFVDHSSNEGKKLDEEGYALGFTSLEDDVLAVTIRYEGDEDEEQHRDTAERLLHELAHVAQKKIVFDDAFFEDYPYLQDIIIEGGATSKMKMMLPPVTEKMSTGFFEWGDATIKYAMENGNGYQKEVNFYYQLLYLAGYDVMEGVTLCDPLSSIERSITRRHGADTAKTVLGMLKSIYDEEENPKKDSHRKQFECAIKLERTVLDCIEKEIDQLGTKKETEVFTNRYRAYMIHLLPRVYKNRSKDGMLIEVTYDKKYLKKAQELDCKMADKIVKTGAFGVKSVTAADSLVYTATEHIPKEDWLYDWVFVPVDLYGASFKECDDEPLCCVMKTMRRAEAFMKRRFIIKEDVKIPRRRSTMRLRPMG